MAQRGIGENSKGLIGNGPQHNGGPISQAISDLLHRGKGGDSSKKRKLPDTTMTMISVSPDKIKGEA